MWHGRRAVTALTRHRLIARTSCVTITPLIVISRFSQLLNNRFLTHGVAPQANSHTYETYTYLLALWRAAGEEISCLGV